VIRNRRRFGWRGRRVVVVIGVRVNRSGRRRRPLAAVAVQRHRDRYRLEFGYEAARLATLFTQRLVHSSLR
jgi:hypothetical protein